MKRYCLTLDLKNDPQLIAEYEAHHRRVAPEIIQSIQEAGITVMDIYRFNNRLFMIMETTDSFTFEHKQQMDLANEKVQEWEQLMWKYQQPVGNSSSGEKWVLMDPIFKLNDEQKL